MSVYVQYPDDWIGVPEFGDGEAFATPGEWAQALADELIALSDERLEESERIALIGALAVAGAGGPERGTPERGAQATYVHLRSLRGSLELVDLVLVPRSAVGDASAAEVAGSLDPDAINPPTITALSTESGLRGALVIRHAPFDDEAPHIVTLRATAALDVGNGFAVLGTATTELAHFEAFRPNFLALIESVKVGA